MIANWFTPKRYGYGAAPATWRGWALVAGLVGAVLLLARGMIGFNWLQPPGFVNPIMLFKFILLLIMALISKRHTDGEWHWR